MDQAARTVAFGHTWVKRHGQLFESFCEFKNLALAAQKAQLGKRFKGSVSNFNFYLEQNLLTLQKELRDGSYRCGPYTSFYIYEPKQRFISAAPYRDRIVHQALCQIINPIFERTFIHDLYSNRLGKGTHRAVDRYQQFCRLASPTPAAPAPARREHSSEGGLNTYVLKCDIQKYFASVDQAVLLDLVEKKIKDQRLMDVIRRVVKSFVSEHPGKGMPLGNLTSQLFANVYLSAMDHYIKEQLGCRYYIRYVDDFVIFDPSKEKLTDIKQALMAFLVGYQLQLHPKKSQLHQVTEGVRFLGYRIFPKYRLLDQANVKRFRRRIRRMQGLYASAAMSWATVKQSLSSWNAHASHADSYRLREALFNHYTFSKGQVAALP